MFDRSLPKRSDAITDGDYLKGGRIISRTNPSGGGTIASWDCGRVMARTRDIISRNKGSVFREDRKSFVEPKPSGRPATIHPDVMAWFESFVSEEYSTHRPISYESIVDYLESVEYMIINVDTLRYIIAADACLKCVEGRPMERKRVEMLPAEETFYERLKEVITGLPAGLVFNADENGYQEWTNCTVQRVVVPVSHPDEVIEVPSPRSNKRGCGCSAIVFSYIQVIRLGRWMPGSSEFTNIESPEYSHLTG
jgi:hypothetical protein